MTPLPQPELNTAPPYAGDASDWHTRSIDEALEHLAAESHGLSTADADRRRITYGANELEATSHESAWRILAAQFQNVLILILLAGTLVSGFLGHTL